MRTLSEIETCTAVKRTVDARVRIDPGPHALGWRARDGMEQYCDALERWAQEIMEFFRDHRHQDVNSVHVERDVRDHCSKCKQELEPVRYGTDPEEDCEQYTGCANCGARIVRA